MDYTKGEWKADKTKVIIPVKDGFNPTKYHPTYIVAQCSTYCSPPYSEAAANAHLIAAAPKMYEALKEVHFIPDCGGDYCFLATEGTPYEVPEPEGGCGDCPDKNLCRVFARLEYIAKQALAAVEGK
jgi:hypothetical protein